MSDKAYQMDKNNSTEDYLNAVRQGKTAFGDGNLLGVPGANRWHNLIGTNAAIAIGSRLHGHKCDIYVNGMCVKMKNNRYCYPDVAIVNGEPQFADNHFDVLLNPTVIVEVFSGKTNTSDKTEKLESYLAMDSVRECLLVKEDEMRVEHYAKQNAKQWIYRIYNERDDVISIESVNCKVSLQEIYASFRFDKQTIEAPAAPANAATNTKSA